MKTLKELYEMLLDRMYLSKLRRTLDGICGEISKLELSERDCIRLRKHFRNQRPVKKGRWFWSKGKHVEFANHSSFVDARYWWHTTEEGHLQRIEFIKYLITKV